LNKPGVTLKVNAFKDKQGKIWTLQGEGRTAIDGIPMHRITNEEVAKRIARTDDLSDLSNSEKARLINAGFTSIGLDDGTVIILN